MLLLRLKDRSFKTRKCVLPRLVYEKPRKDEPKEDGVWGVGRKAMRVKKP